MRENRKRDIRLNEGYILKLTDTLTYVKESE